MKTSARYAAAIASVLVMLASGATVASAQDLTDVLNTTMLNGILTTIALPQVPVPDLPSDGSQQPSTQQQQPAQSAPAAPAHANGWYCKGESKRHVRGTKGTPFSRCVTAMARLRTGAAASPARACSSLSRKHFAGMKRSPYAVCVAGGRKLVADLQ